jgi:hypothetical protein
MCLGALTLPSAFVQHGPCNSGPLPGGSIGNVWEAFGSSVNFSPGQGLKEFFVVVSVGRCKLRLYEASVPQILQ